MAKETIFGLLRLGELKEPFNPTVFIRLDYVVPCICPHKKFGGWEDDKGIT